MRNATTRLDNLRHRSSKRSANLDDSGPSLGQHGKSVVLVILLFALAITGCSDSRRPTKWQPGELIGHRLELIHPAKIESYAFHQNGMVAATLGTRGGMATAPMFEWEIDDKGVLIIKSSKGGVEARIRKLYEENGQIEAECKGILFWSPCKYRKK